MSKFKVKNFKLYLLFALVIFGLMGFAVTVINSERFSVFVSKQISQSILEKVKSNVEFKKVTFRFFPSIYADISDVTFKLDSENKLLVKSASVRTYFSYLDIFWGKSRIEKLEFTDAAIEIETNSNNNKKIDPFVEITNIQELIKSSPVAMNEISINEAKVKLNNNDLKIKKLNIILGAKIDVDFDLINLNLNNAKIDQVILASTLSSQNIDIKSLNIIHHNSRLNLAGQYNNKQEVKVKLNGKIKTIDFKAIAELVTKDKEILNIETDIDINGSIFGTKESPNAKLNLRAVEVKSAWLNAKTANATLFYTNGNIGIANANVNFSEKSKISSHGIEKYFYSLKNNKFISGNIDLETENINSRDFLHYLDTSLHPMDLTVSGKLNLDWGSVVTLKAVDRVVAHKVSIIPTNDKIIDLKNVSIKKLQIEINKKYDVAIDLQAIKDNLKINTRGVIDDKGVNFKIENSVMDFDKFGKIANIEMSGIGPIEGTISGQNDDIKFNFKLKIENLALLGFFAKKASTAIEINLKQGKVTFEGLELSHKNSNIRLNGDINYDAKNPLDLHVEIDNSPLSELREVAPNILNAFLPYIASVNGDINAEFHISKGYDVNKLDLQGRFSSKKIIAYNEVIQNMKNEISMRDGMVKVKSIENEVGLYSGSARYNVTYDLNGKNLNYNVNISGVRLRDILFYKGLGIIYDGKMNVAGTGVGPISNVKHTYNVSIDKGKVGSFSNLDSKFVVEFNNEYTKSIGSLLKGAVRFEQCHFAHDSSQSYLKSNFGFRNIKIPMVILNSNNLFKQVRGSLFLETDLLYPGSHFDKANGTISLKNLVIEMDKLSYYSVSSGKNIILENGNIKKWFISIKSNLGGATSEAKGSFASGIKINNKLNLEADLLQYFIPNLSSVTGKIKGQYDFILFKDHIDTFADLTAESMNISSSVLPGEISSLTAKLSGSTSRFLIDKLSGKFLEGDVSGGGVINSFFPLSVNIALDYSNIKYPLFKHSHVMVSGKGSIAGNGPPYLLSAQSVINSGNIQESIQDFMSSEKNLEYAKYLPETVVESASAINFNINAEIINPITVKNNLVEVKAKGALSITGSPKQMKIVGELLAIPGISKFLFKGQEFILSEAKLDFPKDSTSRVPEMKMNGLAQISQYQVSMKASGLVNNLKVDMTSDPPLSREDIVSLITLGITSDMSKKIDENTRQAVTSVGLGSLLFDQLNLNESVNSALGLKLSISPELVENEKNLLQGKSGTSTDSSQAYKSATKFKVGKELMPKLKLNLSSTFGQPSEEKQEVNIDYEINDRIMLQGVYELKPVDPENAGQSPSSIGGDLKMRWSF